MVAEKGAMEHIGYGRTERQSKTSIPRSSLKDGNHHKSNVYPIPRRQILDSSKLKEFADNNFKFDEDGKKLSKWVENTVGKGVIARYEQFLFSHSVFKRLVSQGHQRVSLCGNGLTFRLKMLLV